MVGITIKKDDGQVILDMTMSISQTVGYVDTGAVNGSIQIPLPPQGKIAIPIVVPLVDIAREKGKAPAVAISGTTLSWAYSYTTNGWGFFSANCRIYYGYY
ncbi:hypothetical protein [Pseudomonas gingeri]|uniref:hypothetical protein n=1 Tax=Pseudomonas gingeri TaxID=117681 RepID=UPI0015B7FFFB|nr:hypothetical protein [Pseudomonas gingeri]NWE68930.1 hypothetical protein [Pseudomonas gingeri]